MVETLPPRAVSHSRPKDRQRVPAQLLTSQHLERRKHQESTHSSNTSQSPPPTRKPRTRPSPLPLSRPLSKPSSPSSYSSYSTSALPKSSSNYIQNQPDSPLVISSIIASFEDVAPAIKSSSHTSASRAASRAGSHHSSVNDASASPITTVSRSSSRKAHSVPIRRLRHSVSLGMDFNAYQTSIEEEYGSAAGNRNDRDDGAAAFPVVPTCRRESNTSPFPSPLLSGGLKGYFNLASPRSRSSLSLNGADVGRGTLSRSPSKLSIDSQPRRLVEHEAKADSSKLRASLRRPSKDSLLPNTIREERVAALVTENLPAATATPGPATATTPIRETMTAQLSPQTPVLARTSPTGKLHWEDAKSEIINTSPTGSSSPRKYPISDAIPLRVSSLNRTTSPRKQKSRPAKTDKGKRKEASLRLFPEPPAESTQLLGLDEHDNTLKRIRELKQKREDRLKKEKATAEHNDHREDRVEHPDPSRPSSPTRTDRAHAVTSESDRQRAKPKSANGISLGAPDTCRAHKMLGLNGPSKSSDPGLTALPDSHLLDQRNHSAHTSSEFIKRRPPDFSRRRRASDSFDNTSSSRPPFDHSDARASHAHAHAQADNTVSHRRTAAKLRLLNGLDVEASDLNPPNTPQSSGSRRSRSSSNNLGRWSYSDLSVQAEGSIRERRKSMSDAYTDRTLEEEVLRERRSSVTASVANYLGAPRLNQKIRSAFNGRLISFSEVGDPAGAAVIVCVGMGLTRYVSAFYDELAATLGLRLITLDRPGVGESEPYPERERVGPLSWPDDVVAVTQHLGISQFSLLAHSAGAIYALATALILPHRIRGKVQLLAPWIPPSQFDTFGVKDPSPGAAPVGALPRSQRLFRVLPLSFFKAANSGIFSTSSLKPSGVRSPPLLSPTRNGPRNGKPKRRPEPSRHDMLALMDQMVPEKPIETMFPLPELAQDEAEGNESANQPQIQLSATATPTDPEWSFVADALNAAEHSARERQSAYSSLLTEQTWNLATRNSNPAVDLLVCLERNRDIGFRYVDIQRQIVITHGSEDKRVPVENVRWLGEQINRRAATNWSPDAKQEFRERGGCEVRVLPGEGHGLMASPGVMADVLADIGREWMVTKW